MTQRVPDSNPNYLFQILLHVGDVQSQGFPYGSVGQLSSLKPLHYI